MAAGHDNGDGVSSSQMDSDSSMIPPTGVSGAVLDVFASPLNLILLVLCAVLLYRIYVKRKADAEAALAPPSPPQLARLKKQDMTLEQLRQYDGIQGPEQRVCVAVNNRVFDVTRGRRFYGPGGPYAEFAGRDASRALALFSVDAVKDEYDDLSDLNTVQMESVKEWEMQFDERYDFVGRLLKPGEEPNEYSDDEDNQSQSRESDQSKSGSPSDSSPPPLPTDEKTKDD